MSQLEKKMEAWETLLALNNATSPILPRPIAACFCGRRPATCPFSAIWGARKHSLPVCNWLGPRVIPALFSALFSRYFALNNARFAFSPPTCIRPAKERP